MIAVAGFNTSLDKLLIVDDLVPGTVLRARDVEAWPGGKGVHVALTAAVLGAPVTLTGLMENPHRAWFEAWLGARGVKFHGIPFDGPVRTCLTIHDRRGHRTTEIREPGPTIEEALWRTAAAHFQQHSREARVAVLSGSVPPGAPSSAYADLVNTLAPPVLVDAAGDLLRHAVDAAPFCVKPNREEAEALTGVSLESAGAAERAARALGSRGVRLVVVSLGDAGAVASWDGRVCRITPPAVVPVNVVGAGDCLLGGVAVGVSRGGGIDDVLRLAVACGTAKVLSPEIGVVRREDIDEVLRQVRLNWQD
jgi:1-phosphofructokinase family hexose kinase